jgi:glycosyltransferase involved in cell wall biosynthesis
VVDADIDMLRNAGHRVITFIEDSAFIGSYGPLRKAALFATATWNPIAYSRIRDLVVTERPDIAHCHNLFPLVSPSAYYACKAAGLPVVQTLHNYRLLCPAGTLFCRGNTCDRCARNLGHGIWRGCYRGSRIQTAAMAAMLRTHRARKTWTTTVDAYIALTESSRARFLAAGLPAKRIHVKPNFLAHDPGLRIDQGSFALFVGRLSPEKGLLEMLHAWQRLAHVPLIVAGDGPLGGPAAKLAQTLPGANISFTGPLERSDAIALVKRSRFLVFPSRWSEPFGMTLVEAAACGVPAIASRVGGVPEIVVDNRTGLLFDPSSDDDLVRKVDWAWNHPGRMQRMGFEARCRYMQHFAAQKNYDRTMEIYESTLRTQHEIAPTSSALEFMKYVS